MQGGVSEAHHTGDGAQIRIEVGVEGGVVVADGAVGILEAVAGQNADHRGAGWHFIFALEQACHRGSAGGFTEDSLLAAKQLVGRDDLRVGHIQERAIAGFASCQGFGSVDRVANANGGGDGFGSVTVVFFTSGADPLAWNPIIRGRLRLRPAC